MRRVDYYEMYRTPAFHQPPPISELANNTMYPNMNSIEYRHKPISNDKTPNRMYPFLETFDISDDGTVILAANAYNDRVWTGALWGYNNFTDIDGNVNGKELFSLNFQTPITKLRFLEKTMVSVGFSFAYSFLLL